MDWGRLLFNFSGRTNRAKYWIAILIYCVIYVVFAILGYVTDQNAIVQSVSGMIEIVMLISSLAVGVKRLHDRDKSGWYLVLFYIVPSVLVVAGIVISLAFDDAMVAYVALSILASAIGVWAFVELGCLRGTVGSNQYGPDPIASALRSPV